MLLIGCVGNKTISKNTVIELTAENVPEGIRLTFDYIPPETDHTAILISTDKGENIHRLSAEFNDSDYSFPFGSLGQTSLTALKQTRTIICPFVQNGLNYTIRAYVHKNDGSFSSYETRAEIIPENGILFIPNNITLKINEAKTGAELSAFPELTDTNHDIKSTYSYLIHVNEDEKPTEGTFDNLIFDFSENLKDFKPGSTLYNITPFCLLRYNNVTWNLQLCESELF